VSAELPKPLVTPGTPVARFLVQGVLWLLRRLPLSVVRWTARQLASIAYFVGLRRRVTLENLTQAFPKKSRAECRALAKQVYQSMAQAAVEAVLPKLLQDATLALAMNPEDWCGVDVLLAEKKPFLVASAHFGSWEFFAEFMASQGHALSAVARPLSGAFNEAIVAARQASGMELILQRGALAHMLGALRRGRVVGQMIDQVVPLASGVLVEFFGRQASTTPAVSMAAIRAQVPVFVILSHWEHGALKLIIEGPVPVPAHPNLRERLRLHTALLTGILEKHIRSHPTQWLWLHRRWKKT
jgi:Kdo2-lipid IVA lauroyltransferase/acyltransferase